MSHHEARPCSHHPSGATRHSSGQRQTPSASHSASVSSAGGAHPLLTSNQARALRMASVLVRVIATSCRGVGLRQDDYGDVTDREHVLVPRDLERGATVTNPSARRAAAGSSLK